jgi:hypothetical protein
MPVAKTASPKAHPRAERLAVERAAVLQYQHGHYVSCPFQHRGRAAQERGHHAAGQLAAGERGVAAARDELVRVDQPGGVRVYEDQVGRLPRLDGSAVPD